MARAKGSHRSPGSVDRLPHGVLPLTASFPIVGPTSVTMERKVITIMLAEEGQQNHQEPDPTRGRCRDLEHDAEAREDLISAKERFPAPPADVDGELRFERSATRPKSKRCCLLEIDLFGVSVAFVRFIPVAQRPRVRGDRFFEAGRGPGNRTARPGSGPGGQS
jgi:hypothetical protein